jgi:hypothetical protein
MSSAKIRIILGVLAAKQLIRANRKERRIRFVFIEFLRAFFGSKNKSIE